MQLSFNTIKHLECFEKYIGLYLFSSIQTTKTTYSNYSLIIHHYYKKCSEARSVSVVAYLSAGTPRFSAKARLAHPVYAASIRQTLWSSELNPPYPSPPNKVDWDLCVQLRYIETFQSNYSVCIIYLYLYILILIHTTTNI